jgi:hypothetical protein
MYDFDVAPMPVEVFGNQTAVAVFGFVFAAQQAAIDDYIVWDGGLDEAALNRGVEMGFVNVPGYALLSICVQQRVGW